MIGSGSCPFCKKDNRVGVTDREITGLDKWNRGLGNIQDVMPYLSSEKREILVSGICLSCQKNLFGSVHLDTHEGYGLDEFYNYDDEDDDLFDINGVDFEEKDDDEDGLFDYDDDDDFFDIDDDLPF